MSNFRKTPSLNPKWNDINRVGNLKNLRDFLLTSDLFERSLGVGTGPPDLFFVPTTTDLTPVFSSNDLGLCPPVTSFKESQSPS